MTTLLDTKEQLLDYFCHHSIFSRDELHGIEVPPGLVDLKEALVVSALEGLEEQGFIARIGEFNWILRAPLNFVPQTVEVSIATGIQVADLINSYLDSQGVEGARCDPANLRESDILMLITIFRGFLGSDPAAPGDN